MHAVSSENAQLQGEITALQGRVNAVEVDKVAATKEVQKLEGSLAVAKAGAAAAIQQKEQLQAAAEQIQKLEGNLEAAKAEAAAAKQQQGIAQEIVQAVLMENAKLRQEVKAFQEVRPGQADRSDESETFWSRVVGAIACARTQPKPNTSARTSQSGPVRLVMPPVSDAQAALGIEHTSAETGQ
eukprot:g21509.t1